MVNNANGQQNSEISSRADKLLKGLILVLDRIGDKIMPDSKDFRKNLRTIYESLEQNIDSLEAGDIDKYVSIVRKAIGEEIDTDEVIDEAFDEGLMPWQIEKKKSDE